MQDLAQAAQRYRAQIAECAQAMTVAKNDAVSGYLVGSNAASTLKMFTDGNLEKRFQKLETHFNELTDAFEDLEELLVAYVKEVPLAAYATESSDAQQFLSWLENRRRLTAEQRDYATLIRSRYAVELAAEQNRFGHVRFQELWPRADEFAPEWGTNVKLWIHANPIQTWAEFESHALIDSGDPIPATVVFFAVRNDVHTAVLETTGVQILRALNTLAPCRLLRLLEGCSNLECDEIIEVCRDLADVGLTAFG